MDVGLFFIFIITFTSLLLCSVEDGTQVLTWLDKGSVTELHHQSWSLVLHEQDVSLKDNSLKISEDSDQNEVSST